MNFATSNVEIQETDFLNHTWLVPRTTRKVFYCPMSVNAVDFVSVNFRFSPCIITVNHFN